MSCQPVNVKACSPCSDSPCGNSNQQSCYIYIVPSTQVTVEKQLEVLTNYAKSNSYCILCTILEDSTDRSPCKRTGLSTILKSIEPGQTILVHSVNSLMFNNLHQLEDVVTIMKKTKAKKADIVCVTDNYDTKTPSRRFMLTTWAAHLQFQSESL